MQRPCHTCVHFKLSWLHSRYSNCTHPIVVREMEPSGLDLPMCLSARSDGFRRSCGEAGLLWEEAPALVSRLKKFAAFFKRPTPPTEESK